MIYLALVLPLDSIYLFLKVTTPGDKVVSSNCSKTEDVDSNDAWSNPTPLPSSSEVIPQQRHLEILAQNRQKENKENLKFQNSVVKEKCEKLMIKIKTMQKREQRSHASNIEDSSSPRSRVKKILKIGDEKVISKKLLFAESLVENLGSEYKGNNLLLLRTQILQQFLFVLAAVVAPAELVLLHRIQKTSKSLVPLL